MTDEPEPDDELDAREAARVRRRDHDAEAARRDLMRSGMGKVFKQITDSWGEKALPIRIVLETRLERATAGHGSRLVVGVSTRSAGSPAWMSRLPGWLSGSDGIDGTTRIHGPKGRLSSTPRMASANNLMSSWRWS